MSEETDSSPKSESSPGVPEAESGTPPPPSPKRKSGRQLFGWGSIAVLGAALAIVANLSEILGWFAPDDTRELVEETRSTMQHTDEKVSELITLLVNQAAASGVSLDMESEDAIRNAVRAIAVSGDRQKQAALDQVAAGDVEGAAASLEKLAATQAEAVSATRSSAAETWAEAAALYESIDVQKAADAYVRASDLAPSDAVLLEKAGHALFTAGRMGDSEQRFSRALSLDPDPAIRSSSLRGLGHIAQRRASYADAEAYFEESLEVAAAAAEGAQRVYALRSLGLLARSRGDTGTAMELLTDSLSYAQEYGDDRLRAFVLVSLGTTAAEIGEYEVANARLDEALQVYQAQNDRAKQALVIGNLGAVALKAGDIETAEPFLLESVELGESLQWHSSVAYDLINLAMISGERQDYQAADAHIGRAQAIAEREEMNELLPVIVFNRGQIAESAGDLEAACQYYAEATPIFVEMGSEYAGLAEQTLAQACTGAAGAGNAGTDKH